MNTYIHNMKPGGGYSMNSDILTTYVVESAEFQFVNFTLVCLQHFM